MMELNGLGFIYLFKWNISSIEMNILRPREGLPFGRLHPFSFTAILEKLFRLSANMYTVVFF